MSPTGGLTAGLDGNVYGHCTTDPQEQGAAFRLTPAGEVTIIVRFGPTHGHHPISNLFRAADGSFYGTTRQGGDGNQGTAFHLTLAGELTTLAAFPAIAGETVGSAWPRPILAPDGQLYGVIEEGGAARCGALYRVSPGGGLAVLVEFSRPDRTGE